MKYISWKEINPVYYKNWNAFPWKEINPVLAEELNTVSKENKGNNELI